MSTNRMKSIALAMVTGLTSIVMTAAPVFASTGQATDMQIGMSANTASAPINGWVQIAPHATEWFKFKYGYDNTKDSKDRDNTPSQALVELKMQDPGSVGFEVWTPGRLQNPQYAPNDIHHSNGMFEPVGVGSPMFMDVTHHHDANGMRDVVTETNPDVLVWTGSQRTSDTFYVVVKNKTDTPATYMLSVSGPDVAY